VPDEHAGNRVCEGLVATLDIYRAARSRTLSEVIGSLQVSVQDVQKGRGHMMRLNVVELRQSLAEVLNRAEYQGERIVIHRRGKDAAAIISIEDLTLLEKLIEDAEDRLDVNAARDALAESKERIPYAEVRKRLGLDDEQKAKRPNAKARATKF